MKERENILIYRCSCSKDGPRKTNSYGTNIYCPNKEVVNQCCGSGRGRECLGNANMFQCCKYVDNTSSPSQFLYSRDLSCKWKYSNWYGKSANYGYGYVMAGSCGSGSGKECPGRNVHGAYCCKLHNSAGKNICFH